MAGSHGQEDGSGRKRPPEQPDPGKISTGGANFRERPLLLVEETPQHSRRQSRRRALRGRASEGLGVTSKCCSPATLAWEDSLQRTVASQPGQAPLQRKFTF